MTSTETSPLRNLRGVGALASYWLLFIVLPLGAFLLWRGISPASLGLLPPLFLLLVLIGERGFRRWKRLWRVPPSDAV